MRIYYPDQPHNVPMKKDRYGNIYYLAEEYRVNIREIDLLVKKNFRYDGASVPRWAWTLSGLRPDGLLRSAALIHDILYIQNGKPNKIPSPDYNLKLKIKYHMSRKDADKLFLKIMLESGVKKWRAKMAYYGVRIGGAFMRKF